MANAATLRIKNLRSHLGAENPDLVPLVDAYARMDGVLRRMRLLQREETLTNRIGWWPVVSAVGLYSSGKSTLINDLLGQTVQRTGNQAVDDKFTVLCHGTELRELPGTALDADPRFPFHAMGNEIEKVAPGEGKMVDRYLALKTVPSDRLRGLILVDSPGFDSDKYRDATLRLIDHILDLSDLTLVLFDARKPEPGVMRDTLDKLVARVKDRADANKFLFVLNQIDATSREDNLEEVVGAWQRALASVGIAGGRFYSVFSEKAADGSTVTTRLREIRARDMEEIARRIREVPSIRGYRVANGLEAVSKDLREEVVPLLTRALKRWRTVVNGVTWAALAAAVAAGLLLWLFYGPPPDLIFDSPWPSLVAVGLLLAVLLIRQVTARFMTRRLAAELPALFGGFQLRLRDAFVASTRWALLRKRPKGWSGWTERRLRGIHDTVLAEVRKLNDRFARPGAPPASAPDGEPVPRTADTPAPVPRAPDRHAPDRHAPDQRPTDSGITVVRDDRAGQNRPGAALP
ncbi:dynamin family protein [Oleisolibacter albus]|uniref:dynamin family protein n=1 Tax=Oleisolibacter albus TaxID=2171757 RepID=UPI000DF1B989|nr:dynamin family protein [Oleisolibacter albus]